MTVYSTTHQAMYAHMASEMLMHGGFQDSIRDMLAVLSRRDTFGPGDAAHLDNLYSIYADSGVIDD